MSRYKRYERYKDSGVEWIGEIPEHWELRKIKHIGMLSAGGVNKKVEEGEELFKSVHYMDVYRNSGKAIGNDDDYLVVSATQSQAKNCTLRKGDVLFTSSSETPDDIGHAVTISEDLEQTLYGYHLIRLRLDRDIPADYSYRKYMFNNYFIRSYFSSRAQGITRYGLKYDDYKEAVVFIPPINEQNIIANFLDQKTAEIDGLIADKEKLIELLQEKRQAIITEAVTKGLNQNVKMKDSGIEWIGEIPEHWEVKRIKYLATVNPNKSEVRHLPSEQEVTFIPMEKIIATGKVDYSLTNTIENLINGYTYFRDGDIIMAKVTPCFENGNIAIVNGLLNGIGFGTTELHVLRCNNKCYNRFLFYYLQSDIFKSKGISEMYGVAGLKRIPTDFILNYKLGIPDYQEQEQIALYLDNITGKIDTLISDIQTQIDKLREYRQSIISEAATGKIKVL
jgi:type I restriction enzyme S subunit